MARKFIDCRQFPSEMNCTIAISADTEAELLDAAVQYAVVPYTAIRIHLNCAIRSRVRSRKEHLPRHLGGPLRIGRRLGSVPRRRLKEA